MKIENWSIVVLNCDPYQPPETQISGISGQVYNHPTYKDGKHITTSKIEDFKDGCVVTRSGSIYELGKIDPLYAKVYPNADKIMGSNA